MSNLDNTLRILETKLDNFRSRGNNEYMASCPCHDDHTPSLSISINNDRILLNCFAGCSQEAILDAVGLTFNDLIHDFFTLHNFKYSDSRPKNEKSNLKFITRYRYRNLDSTLVFENVKYLDENTGKKTFRQRRLAAPHSDEYIWNLDGVKKVLYNLFFVDQAIKNGTPIIVVEGEKDCETVQKYAFGNVVPTTCVGSNGWLDSYAETLTGVKKVYICPDNDQPGRKFAHTVAKSLLGKVDNLYVIDLVDKVPNLVDGGDISDYLSTIKESDRAEAITELIEQYSKPYNTSYFHFKKELEAYNTLGVLENSSNAPLFPVDCLPSKIREFAIALSKYLQVPVDMPAIALLGVMSACLQSKFCVCKDDKHIEPLNDFYCLIAKSGTKKSPVMKIVSAPLEDYEFEYNRKNHLAILQSQTKKEILEKRLEHLKNNLKNAEKDEDKTKWQTQLDKTLKEMSEHKEIKPICILGASNATPEAITSDLKDNNGNLAIFSSEGDIFDMLNGQYSQNGAMLGDVLKAHSGDTIKVSRKTRAKETIRNPKLTLMIAVQPFVLNEIVKNPKFNGTGFIARFLYSYPKTYVGDLTKTAEGTQIEIPDNVSKEYEQLCRDMLELLYENEITLKTLLLSREAREDYNTFSNDIESKLGDFGELDYMSDWASKLKASVLRIAGLIHATNGLGGEFGKEFARNPNQLDDFTISKETMKNAIEIGYYFLEHAKICYSQNIVGLATAQHILDRIKAKVDDGKLSFSISDRDILRIVQSKQLNDTNSVKPYLKILVEYGYLKIEESDRKSTGIRGGRPMGDRYSLNPLYFSKA